MPSSKGDAGDLIVHLEVRMPEGQSDELEAALELVEAAFEGDVRADLKLG